ncbi:hypothetical protein QUF70_04710 [Desulfobacterales bacterium HSG17]|nr:hypothetical protein [Desulfobacterales bacterium HSG17]
MINEYALEPEMVATWGAIHNSRFFLHEFGLSQGRLISQYPKKWAKKVWESFDEVDQNDRRRLVELLVQFKKTMIKRKNYIWDDAQNSWLGNALLEHDRHPFSNVMAKSNPGNRLEILSEEALGDSPCPGWENPHGALVNRKAQDMAASVGVLLSHCRWVKFIDPYFSKCRRNHKLSMLAFLKVFAMERPVGPPEKIEIHTRWNGTTMNYLNDFYEKIIPKGLQGTLYQWRQKPGGPRLHNRYILTNLGGVSFQHGLDIGEVGETDDVTRLDLNQFDSHCKQYDPQNPAFDQAAQPIVINGKCIM